jgi:uncharacterized membrane protein
MKILMTIAGAIVGVWCFDGQVFSNVAGGLLIGGSIGYLWASLRQLQALVREREAVTPAVTESRPPASAAVEARPASLPDPEPKTASVVASPASPIPEPAPPAWVQRTVDFLREFFTGERAIPHIGVVILFFGVAFLLKYAVDRSLLPIELRLVGSAVIAMVLLGLGWRLRHRRLAFALALQGGGIGVLYLTVFSALRLYGLIPPVAAFAIMVALCVFSGALAVLQNARALAVLGMSGGFLAPVLASTGAGNHVVLFSYYAVLNAGILGVAWFRSWRELNLLGFLFTFVIGAAWGGQRYRPELFASTEPFLILFFVFYVAVAVLFALRQPVALRGYVDGTIVFGVPVVAFALQAALVRQMPYGLAWSAAVLGAFYILTATALWHWRTATLRLLCEAFLALGVVFATLALPLALDGRWTSAAWALEGAAVIWIGVRQRRLLPRLFGALLIFGAGLFFMNDAARPSTSLAVLNSACLGSAMIAIAALLASRWLQRRDAGLTTHEQPLAAVLFGWGLLWWFGGGLREIALRVSGDAAQIDSTVGFVAVSAIVAEAVGSYRAWPWLRAVALGLLPAGLLLALITIPVKPHVLTVLGSAVWALLLATHAVLLKRREDFSARRYLDFLHGGTVWLISILLAHEVAWFGRQMASGAIWSQVAWVLVPVLAAVAAARVSLPAPCHLHRRAYEILGAAPTLAFGCFVSLLLNLESRADPAPLPYVPLLNPLDLVSLLALIAAVQFIWHERATLKDETLRIVSIAACGLGFVWLNAALLRTLHHWADIPFQLPAMTESVLVQASLSIFWTVIALVVMVLATRRASRTLWMTGAGLLAVVVVKLFLVDLDRTGTVARIVSFIVVGALLLLIGYMAPIPPASARKLGTEEQA